MKKFVYIFLAALAVVGCKDAWHPEGPAYKDNGDGGENSASLAGTSWKGSDEYGGTHTFAFDTSNSGTYTISYYNWPSSDSFFFTYSYSSPTAIITIWQDEYKSSGFFTVSGNTATVVDEAGYTLIVTRQSG